MNRLRSRNVVVGQTVFSVLHTRKPACGSSTVIVDSYQCDYDSIESMAVFSPKSNFVAQDGIATRTVQVFYRVRAIIYKISSMKAYLMLNIFMSELFLGNVYFYLLKIDTKNSDFKCTKWRLADRNLVSH